MYVAYSKSDQTGCAAYRMENPCKFLERFAGVTTEMHMLSSIANTSVEDICVIQRQYYPEAFHIIAHKRKFGVKVVGELDDDFWSLEDDNPAKDVYHPDRIKGAEDKARSEGKLQPGQSFLQTRKFLGEFFRTCDAVTVPTEPLADVLRRFNNHVYVLPNYFDDTILPAYPTPLRVGETFRILWTGSNTHRNDLVPAMSALRRVIEKHPHVRFVVVGSTFPEMDQIPVGNREFYPGFPEVPDYYRLLCNVPAHVAIAPLQENTFNRSKSSCKAIEYGMAGYLPILQDYPPYSALDEGSESLVYVDGNTEQSWYEVLTSLVEFPEGIRERAAAWQETVIRSYGMSSNVHKWVEVYEQILQLKPNYYFPKKLPTRVQ